MKSYFTILIVAFAFTGFSNAKANYTINPVSPFDNITMIKNTITFVWTYDHTDGAWFNLEITNTTDYTNYYLRSISCASDSITIDTSFFKVGDTYEWNGITYGFTRSAIITFTISENLPVELNSFIASVLNKTVNLTWSTATEVNNHGFDVERSSDNKTYNKISFVKGSGNSNSPKNYTFTDQPDGSNTFSYRLKQIDNDGAYVYSDAITVALNPDNGVKLLNNYPNPFNPSTTIKFYVPNKMSVTIGIYNIMGQMILTLTSGQQTAGYHIVYWNGKDSFGSSVASGIYLYKMQAGNYTDTRKMNLLK